MAGVDYVGRMPPGGDELIVQGWRNDGGFYISDDLHSVANYSSEERIAISAEAFRHREPDGVAAWTIADFWSHPADRETTGVNTLCGLGTDWEGWGADVTNMIAAVVEWDGAPLGEQVYHDGIVAAVRIDLETGEIAPIGTDGVYCYQELL